MCFWVLRCGGRAQGATLGRKSHRGEGAGEPSFNVPLRGASRVEAESQGPSVGTVTVADPQGTPRQHYGCLDRNPHKALKLSSRNPQALG